MSFVVKADTCGSLAGTAWHCGIFHAFDSLGGKGFIRRVTQPP